MVAGSRIMLFRKLWPVLLTFTWPVLAARTSTSCPLTHPNLAARDQQIWAEPVRISSFAAIPGSSGRPSCARTRPPEPLATPDPLLDRADPHSEISVSFIVGLDGRVHAPLILKSAGGFQDRAVLGAVRAWRYRPATCNGVPVEMEAKVEFSQR